VTTYTVLPGDTLSKIASNTLGDAARYKEIAQLNDISDPNKINVGMTLQIPVIAVAEPTPPTGEAINLDFSMLADLIGSSDRAQSFAAPLAQCFEQFAIDTPLRAAHFLAQICHESGNLKFTKENLNYSAKALRAVFGKYFPDDQIAEQYARNPEAIANRVYANRMGNDDEQSGDGWAYRGRGLMQLTGKDNYQKFSASYDVDAVSNPDIISEDLTLCVAVAGWYWYTHKLNQYADQDDIKTITKRINGGYNGLDDRSEICQRAKKYFGIG